MLCQFLYNDGVIFTHFYMCENTFSASFYMTKFCICFLSLICLFIVLYTVYLVYICEREKKGDQDKCCTMCYNPMVVPTIRITYLYLVGYVLHTSIHTQVPCNIYFVQEFLSTQQYSRIYMLHINYGMYCTQEFISTYFTTVICQRIRYIYSS